MKRALACLFESDDEMVPAQMASDAQHSSNNADEPIADELPENHPVFLPKVPWTVMLKSAFAETFEKLGKQVQQISLGTSCSGTNAPAIALKVSFCTHVAFLLSEVLFCFRVLLHRRDQA